MDWKKERDLLVAQTMAFVQSVTGKAPNTEAERRIEAAPRVEAAPAEAPDITAVEMLAAEIIAPPKDMQVSIEIPRSIVSSDIRTEMQARVTNFRAHQERFHRERDEYFSATLREARAAVGPSADPGSRSSPAPAANVAKTAGGSHSSESGQGPA
jgi:hypothetical protein